MARSDLLLFMSHILLSTGLTLLELPRQPIPVFLDNVVVLQYLTVRPEKRKYVVPASSSDSESNGMLL